MAPTKAKFAEGEKVLCFHGPLIYEAKCIKVETKPQLKYFIHYNGWNKNWDEWVQESRVLKCNDAGYQKQKELQRAHLAAKASKKTKQQTAKKEKEKEKEKVVKKPEKSKPVVEKKEKATTSTSSGRRTREGTPRSGTPVQGTPVSASTPTPLTQDSGEPKKKRARGDAVPSSLESEEQRNTNVEVKVIIPEELKPWLVDDWDLITRQFRLVNLPAKKTADTVLDEYLSGMKSKSDYDSVKEIVQGIKEYFNVMLGVQLLYKFERIQYAELLSDNPDTPMCQLYGGMHLLRLFVKIGGMLSYIRLDEKSMNTIVGHLHDFLKYLSQNSSELFSLNDYIVASPEYQRKAI